ncbi:unnamed protein product [Pocillopora meandrina]|uniref:Tyr recombinase domain-containing protein n=1 Tax=Pocillopora meandrina TaxID=46732 RepID=A0AAU9WCP7_9CNID|nr:unnamed protein product [Pocillopora meandrina]
MILDLNWSGSVIITSSFMPITQDKPDFVLTTDTSKIGWGAVCGDNKTGGCWDLDEQQYHINYLESKAVLLIPLCLQKIEEDQSSGVLLVPLWSTQPWFPVLLQSLVDHPRFLPQPRNLLTQPHSTTPHPLEKTLKLLACDFSGKASSRETFQMQLNQLSCSPGLFMRGIYKCNPPTPRYQTTWNVKTVLKYLSSQDSVEKLDLKSLTLKLLMLIALVSAQRGQSIHMLDTACMKVTESSYEFSLPEHVKQSRPSFKTPSVILKAYPINKALCVYSHLTEYLRRTKSLRGAETKLFISFVNPHKRVSRDTISRWIRTTMQSAGIDISMFKPHSTQMAATSKAKGASIPLQEILRTAGWSSSGTFDQFYDKPLIEESTFASAVLNND